jgi:single-strand DNA-binding protein
MAHPSPVNSTVLIGRLTRDPVLRKAVTPEGEKSVVTLRMAVRRRRRVDDQDKRSADFFDVTAWEGLAEKCAAHLTKGRLVGVSARLAPTKRQGEGGSTLYGLEVVAADVEFIDARGASTGTDPDDPDDTGEQTVLPIAA